MNTNFDASIPVLTEVLHGHIGNFVMHQPQRAEAFHRRDRHGGSVCNRCARQIGHHDSLAERGERSKLLSRPGHRFAEFQDHTGSARDFCHSF